MKKFFKKIGIVFLILISLIIYNQAQNSQLEKNKDFQSNDNDSQEKAEEKNDSPPIPNYSAQEDSQNLADRSKQDDSSKQETSNIYHHDDIINRLITKYNEIAEFQILPDKIAPGAYSFNAIAICNGVYIMIYNSTDVFVDLSIEDSNDSHIYPVFRDFMMTLDNDLTNDEIYTGWCALLTGKYIGYKYYYLGDNECSGTTNNIMGGKVDYTIKTCNKTYKD